MSTVLIFENYDKYVLLSNSHTLNSIKNIVCNYFNIISKYNINVAHLT